MFFVLTLVEVFALSANSGALHPAGVICEARQYPITVLQESITDSGRAQYHKIEMSDEQTGFPMHYYTSGNIRYLKILLNGQHFLVDDFDVKYWPADRIESSLGIGRGKDYQVAGVRGFSSYSKAELKSEICSR